MLKKEKIVRVIKWILSFLLIFLALIIIFSTKWSLINYQFNNFDQILFTLTSSVASASNDLIEEFIKENVLSYFHQSIDMFGYEEKDLISKSLKLYDEVLSDNRFCLIHNDLHFDNILLDDNHQIILIDFNNSFVAPFDFDLRLLYMSVFMPWKWANSEMDPLQKIEDYKNLFVYLKKYYKELNQVKYLDERMLIYWIYSDFRLLPRFRTTELKESILVNSKKLVNNFYGKASL